MIASIMAQRILELERAALKEWEYQTKPMRCTIRNCATCIKICAYKELGIALAKLREDANEKQ